MSAIEIKKLYKVYSNGTKALEGIDLSVKEGDFFALLGANGAGKTTIIGILTGLVNKTSGSASVFSHNLETHYTQAKKMMGVVPQEINFNMFEKVQDIIVNQAGYFGIERKQAIKESEKVLKGLMLWDKRNVQSKTLSGGMKRRLMIARALINKPKLLILDEPSAGVDVELRRSMWDFLAELNKNGTTILLTTHYLEEVEQLCKRAAMIKDGKIIKNDTVKNLLQMVEKETYIVHVDQVKKVDLLKSYNVKIVDETTIELEVDGKHNFSPMIESICKQGMVIKDLRPKDNRLEQIFLSTLNSK